MEKGWNELVISGLKLYSAASFSMSESTNFFIWTLQTITTTGKGIVILHNYIFFIFLTAVLAFVLFAIILILLDGYVDTQAIAIYHIILSEFYFVVHSIKNISFKLAVNKYSLKLIQVTEYLLKLLDSVATTKCKYLSKPDDSIIHRFELVSGNNIVHGTLLEILWTLLPSVILMLIAVPSFALLYSMDEIILPDYVIRAVGHQWYWSYENIGKLHKNFNSGFDSYMISDRDLSDKNLRLLETDNTLLIPVNTHLRFLFTSSDVLHSWTVPSLGIKVDAVPGRLSQFNSFIGYNSKNLSSYEVGLHLYGQCSEICGVNHGFMPISVILV